MYSSNSHIYMHIYACIYIYIYIQALIAYFIYSNVYLLISDSKFIPPPLSPLGTISLFSM